MPITATLSRELEMISHMLLPGSNLLRTICPNCRDQLKNADFKFDDLATSLKNCRVIKAENVSLKQLLLSCDEPTGRCKPMKQNYMCKRIMS